MSAITLPVPTHSAGDVLPASTVSSIAQILNAVLPVGVIMDFFGLESQVPSGMLLCSGKTVGDASSNATARANADMSALFTHLWTIGNADGSLVIYTSAGATSTFGASASADWSAHKAIALPDMRGRTSAGNDDMGGTDAGRIVTNDAESEKIGGVCGEENHELTEAEMPAHTHTLQRITGGAPNSTNFNPNAGLTNAAVSTYSDVGGASITSTGGGDAHNNMQPTLFLTKMIFTGATW